MRLNVWFDLLRLYHLIKRLLDRGRSNGTRRTFFALHGVNQVFGRSVYVS